MASENAMLTHKGFWMLAGVTFAVIVFFYPVLQAIAKIFGVTI